MKYTTLDPKLQYIIKTLSKTNRKDYENFVINAIWNKLSNPDIEIISQQYVKNDKVDDNKSHYFIDLYFPSLNIGIECDEPYHFGKNQTYNDLKRSIKLQDILHSINSTSYEQIRIKISGTINEINDQINSAVDKIKKRIQDLNPVPWTIQSTEDYFQNKENISIYDRIRFKTINEVCNTLYNAGRKKSKGGLMAHFALPKFINTELANHKLWFPKLAIEISDEFGNETLRPATRTGWTNQISLDGKIITEWNENNMPYKNDRKRRIVFIKYKDSLGFNEYKFAGIFEFSETNNERNIYERCIEICPMLK